MKSYSQEDLINILEEAFSKNFNIKKEYLREYRYLIENIHTINEEERLEEYRKNKEIIHENFINEMSSILPEYSDYFKERFGII